MDVIEKDLLKSVDKSKCTPIIFDFINVSEDEWDKLISNMSMEEACRMLQKKAA